MAIKKQNREKIPVLVFLRFFDPPPPQTTSRENARVREYVHASTRVREYAVKLYVYPVEKNYRSPQAGAGAGNWEYRNSIR